MTSSELAPSISHLRSTVEIFGVLTDSRIVPEPGSEADRELAEADKLTLGDGTWGEGRVRTVHQVALMSYTAALDDVLAMAASIDGGIRTAIPAVVLARAAAEVCSQAWWLLEPGVGARGRAERLQCLRLRSALEGEQAAKADGIDEADWHEYTERQELVHEYSRKLGLDDPRKDRYAFVCGTQGMPSVSRNVAAMLSDVGVEGAYKFHSGFAHGELFALWQGFERGNGRLLRPVIKAGTLQGAIAVAARSLYCPAGRFSDLFGLGTPPQLDEWIDEHDAIARTRALR